MIVTNGLGSMVAASALHEMNTNAKKAQKSAGQLASGKKITSAADDPSGYSISEKMKKNIRSLSQCTSNSETGQNMLDLASAAVDNQISILTRIKALSLNAANDTCNNEDRKIIQEEINQLLTQVDEIAHTTQYNGINLLNQALYSRQEAAFNADAPYRPIPNNIPVLQQAVAGDYMADRYTTILLSPPNIYDPSAVVKGAALTALPAAGSVVWDDSRNTYGRVIQDPFTNARSIQSAAGMTLIQVAGVANGTFPAPASTNVSTPAYAAYTTAPAVGSMVAASGVPGFGNMTPPDLTTAKTYKVAIAPDTNALSFITTNSDFSKMELDFTGLFAAISNVPADLNELGFSFECGGCDQFVTIMFEADTDLTMRYVGISEKLDPKPVCYVIGVKNVTDNTSLLQTIFNGITESFDTSGGSLPSSTDQSTMIADRHDIRLNYKAGTGKFVITKDGPSITFRNGIKGALEKTPFHKPEQEMFLQTGVASSQNTKVSVPNTTLSVLFASFATTTWDIIPTDKDYPKEWPNGYENLSDAEKKIRWREETWIYPANNIPVDITDCVTTQKKAEAFLEPVDQALKYLLRSNTILGAQSNRLNYTEDNLTTAIENETGSMSSICDVNIAKAYLDQATSNILLQASQAMLAQANKNTANVLNLLGQ